MITVMMTTRSLRIRMGGYGGPAFETDWVRDPDHRTRKDESSAVGALGVMGDVVGCPRYVPVSSFNPRSTTVGGPLNCSSVQLGRVC